MQVYDFVVVGAGSAGCAVAARLTESGRFSVLLLEAGPSDKHLWIQMPIGYGKTYYHPGFNWMYRSEPIPGLNDRSVYAPRGKVLGGSSSINAMVYSRGQASDFDDWAAAGNPGWGWKDVLPIYRRMENHALGASEWHGAGGPLHVTDITKDVHPLTHAFVAAGQQAGLTFNPDLNGATLEGVGYYQITTKGGLRMSAARAYLWAARNRQNLRIETGAMVSKLMFEGKRAIGVAYTQGGRHLTAKAGREVILCGGAFNSPQLLQLSGIGAPDLLQGLGISVVHANDAVGANMQDHLCYDHAFRASKPSLNEELLPLWGKFRAGLQYVLTRRGPLSLSVNQGGGYIRSRDGSAHPDIQLYFSPLSYERAPPGVRALMQPDPFPGFYTSISPCRPTSRGSVNIRSADPLAPPAIAPNFMATNEDVDTLLLGAKFLRRLSATPALRGIIDAELKPGPTCQSDDDLIADVRSKAYSVFHPCGTCRMGPEESGNVVDPTLRVHGIAGLRVIDASIFPFVTSGNINAPCIMVGEKGADLILRDAA